MPLTWLSLRRSLLSLSLSAFVVALNVLKLARLIAFRVAFFPSFAPQHKDIKGIGLLL